MLLIDAIRRLNTEHEIRFLLTAYLENLRLHHARYRLPTDVTALPLADARDIETRFAQLLSMQCETQSAVASEATEIFGAAVTRMRDLHATYAASVRPHASATSTKQAAHLLFA